ncbi:MAG: DUF2703 domain-containing protein [Cocleimonas sp.]|nr:DUF2703 domain-containing protein [Cocleimonas sp.]
MYDEDEKTLAIDFLYLDLSVCTRCQDSETNLDASLQTLVDILGNIGHKVTLNKIFIETEEQAIKHQFISSPTIRINGRDIQMNVKESYCETCSSLTNNASINCRTWKFKGEEYSAPPQALIIDAALNEIYRGKDVEKSDTTKEQKFNLPDNLKGYFSNKDQLCANTNKPPETTDSCCESKGCC